MFLTDYVPNPVAREAIRRAALWELERIAKIWQQVEDGYLTEEEAQLRLED